jgi:hypothetical protein
LSDARPPADARELERVGRLARRVEAWLREHREELAPVTEPDLAREPALYVDWSAASAELGPALERADVAAWTVAVFARLRAAGARGGVGGYDEARPVYASEAYRYRGPVRDEWRTVHLGLDLFLEAGAAVSAPLAGAVHSFANQAAPFDYGPCIVLEHRVEDDAGPLRFHTLYGHLSLESLRHLEAGRPIAAGERFAELGAASVNGGWPPHLHLQIVLDMLGARGDFIGSCRPSERSYWLALCPDPNLLARVPDSVFPVRDAAALEARRRGPEPLPIVRASGVERWDEDGQRFLAADAVEATLPPAATGVETRGLEPDPARSALLAGLRELAARHRRLGAVTATRSGCRVELAAGPGDAADFVARVRDRGVLLARDPAQPHGFEIRVGGFTLAQIATVVETLDFVLGGGAKPRRA